MASLRLFSRLHGLMLKVQRFVLLGDRPPLTPEERRLILRVVAVTSVPLSLLVLGAVSITLGYGYYLLQDKTQDNRTAIMETRALAKEVSRQRQLAQNNLAWRVYDQCTDYANLRFIVRAQLQGAIQRAKLAPPSATRTRIIEDLQDGIGALTPRNCVIPQHVRNWKPKGGS